MKVLPIFMTKQQLSHKLQFLQSAQQRFYLLLAHPSFVLFLRLCFSFLGALGSLQLLKFVSQSNTVFINEFIACIVAFVLYFFYKSPVSLLKPNPSYAIVCTIIFSSILIFGGQLEFYNAISWNWRTFIKISLVCFLLYPVFAHILVVVSTMRPRRFVLNPHRHTIIAFCCILTATLLTWIFIFPGIYTYDMASQNEIITNGFSNGQWRSGQWSAAHWSLLYGLLFAGFLDVGKAVFGNYEAGMALAMLAQALFICYVESRIVLFATRVTKNRKVYIGSILFFCMMPFLIVLSVSSAQDVLFAGLFALLFLNLFEMIIDPDNYSKTRLYFFKIPILGILLCLVRNNGVYCLLFAFLVVVIFYRNPIRKHKYRLLALLSMPVVLSFIYSGPIIKSFHLQSDTSIQEILGIPSQQLARTYTYAPESLSSEDMNALRTFYDFDHGFLLYRDYPLIADYTKGSLNSSYTKAHLLDFVGLWAKQGIKNPGKYIEAFMLNSLGYWYPLKDYRDPRLNLDFMNYPGFSMTSAFTDRDAHPHMKKVERQTINKGIAQQIDSIIFDNKWLCIPFYAAFCSMGTYMLLLLFTIGYAVARRSRQLFVPLGLLLGFYFTLLLSPVAIFRYGYPIVMLAPALIATLCQINLYSDRCANRTYKARKAAGAS